jgi:hypothetical protein
MKRIVLVSLVVSSLLFLAPAAQAEPPVKYHILGDAVSAVVYAYDQASCTSTDISLSAHETQEHQTGGPVTQRWLSVGLYTFNDCTLTGNFAEGFVQLNSGDLEVRGSAQTARLQKSLVLQDYNGNLIPVTLDVSWSAIGEPYRTSYHQASHSQYGYSSSHYSGVSRDAEITASVTSGGTNLLPVQTLKWGTISVSNNGAVFH